MGSNSIIEAQIEFEEQVNLEQDRVDRLFDSKIQNLSIRKFMEEKSRDKAAKKRNKTY